MEDNGRKYQSKRTNSTKEGKKDSVRQITVIQIVGCLIILVAAVLLRTFGGNFYGTVRDWYLEAVGDSIVTDDQVSDVKRVVVGLWPSASSAQNAESSSALSGLSSNEAGMADSTAPTSAQGTVSE